MSRPLRIWFAKVGEANPLDPDARRARTHQLAMRARARGHHVTWWNSAFDHPHKQWIRHHDFRVLIENGVDIRFLCGIGYRKNVSLRRAIDNRILSWRFKRTLRHQEPPDIIIASYPPYDVAGTFVRYANDHGVPVIVDIRDPWPDSFLNFVPHKVRRATRLALTYEFRIATNTVSRATALYAVNQAHLRTALQRAQRQRRTTDHIFFNTFDENQHHEAERPKSIEESIVRADGRKIVFFFGMFGSVHDAVSLVRCAKELPENEFFFVLAGKGDEWQMARRLSHSMSNVLLPGWLDLGGLKAYSEIADIGVCPTRYPTDVLPNKAIIYLASGLPVVSGFEGDLARILKDHRCGLNYQAGNLIDLQRSLRQLGTNTNLRHSMSKRARDTYEALFRPDLVYEQYLDSVEALAASSSAERENQPKVSLKTSPCCG